MTSIEAMNEVLQSVQEVTGKPVVVEAVPDLNLHATLVDARDKFTFHTVRYRSSFEPERAYLVCVQCGFLLRAARSSPGFQCDLTSTPEGRSEVERLLQEHFRQQKRSLPAPLVQGLRDQLLNGLLLQLRSMPIGLRVDSWLASTYPMLRDLQRVAVIRQLNENAGVLRPEVSALAPQRILAANLGMNAAFAAFFSRLWNDLHIAEPYRTAGHLATGEALLQRFDEISDDAVDDITLIDAWGLDLQLVGWYAFVRPQV